MKPGAFFTELCFYVSLALGISIFSLGFHPFLKVLLGHLAPDGLKQAAAA